MLQSVDPVAKWSTLVKRARPNRHLADISSSHNRLTVIHNLQPLLSSNVSPLLPNRQPTRREFFSGYLDYLFGLHGGRTKALYPFWDGVSCPFFWLPSPSPVLPLPPFFWDGVSCPFLPSPSLPLSSVPAIVIIAVAMVAAIIIIAVAKVAVN